MELTAYLALKEENIGKREDKKETILEAKLRKALPPSGPQNSQANVKYLQPVQGKTFPCPQIPKTSAWRLLNSPPEA